MLPNLGPRGEGWVALQIAVFAAFVLGAVLGPSWPSGVAGWSFTVGVAIALAGGALATAAILGLGSDLTAFPKPKESMQIRTSGVYGMVRHPIYGGLILVVIGGSLTNSPLALIPAVSLALLFDGKRRVEERWLVEHDPAYSEYRHRVAKAFIPGVW